MRALTINVVVISIICLPLRAAVCIIPKKYCCSSSDPAEPCEGPALQAPSAKPGTCRDLARYQ